MTTLWSRDREIQEIARKVPDPLSMKAGSGNETMSKTMCTYMRGRGWGYDQRMGFWVQLIAANLPQ